MLLVIFGAGASYDSDPRFPPIPSLDDLPGKQFVEYNEAERSRPPLARDLFSNENRELLARYPRCASLITRLYRYTADGTPLEDALEIIRQDALSHPRLAGELLVLRYYLRDVLAVRIQPWVEFTQSATNYADLLGSLDDWRHVTGNAISLVTFNYDRLASDACYNVIGPSAGPIWQDYYGLYHVHGFIGWAREVAFDPSILPATAIQEEWQSAAAWSDLTGSVAGYLSNIAHALDFRENFINYQELPDPIPEGIGYVPAIAVPTVHKENFECPRRKLEQLSTVFPRVSRVLIVGWRGMEDHFLQLWATALDGAGESSSRVIERIQVVDVDPVATSCVVERLQTLVGITSPDVRISTAGFSGFLRGSDLTDFLSSDS